MPKVLRNYLSRGFLLNKRMLIKCAMQQDFDDLILASPIINILGGKLFFLFFKASKCKSFT